MKASFSSFTNVVFFTAVFAAVLSSSCSKGDPNRAPLRINFPIIDSISPKSGPFGTVVTIYGKNLGGSSTEVRVNDKPAVNKTTSDTKFTVTVSDSSGTGAVVVKNPVGQATGPVFNYEFTTNYIVSLFAGSVNGDLGFADLTGTAARFNYPRSIAIDAAGKLLYIADAGNNRIRTVTIPGAVVSTLAGNTTAGYLPGNGAAAQFSGPTAVALDPQGNVYVSDGGNNRIRKISIINGAVGLYAGTGAAGSTNATPVASTFTGPAGLAVDGQGTLYIADAGSNKIRTITTSGIVGTLAGSGTAGSMPGLGIAAQFNSPAGLVFDTLGNLYVGDFMSNKVRKITAALQVSTIAGTGDATSLDGAFGSATFFSPFGLARDVAGNLYVADFNGNRIRQMNFTTAQVKTFAGNGSAGITDGDALLKATFNRPAGMVIDAQGNFYVVEAGNNCVRKMTPYKH